MQELTDLEAQRAQMIVGAAIGSMTERLAAAGVPGLTPHTLTSNVEAPIDLDENGVPVEYWCAGMIPGELPISPR
ncbi:MAG TPA: hypothetical protein VGB45_06160 [Abditibacterium sp.]|jgi:hypothetical protein